MPTEIWCAIISGVVTLIVSVGSFQASVRKDRDKQKEDLEKMLLSYYEKNRAEIEKIKSNDLQEIRDDITDMGASLQNKLTVVEVKVETLSSRVEKHNQVIERTYKLEQAVEDLKRA